MNKINPNDLRWLNKSIYFMFTVVIVALLILFLVASFIKDDINLIIIPYCVLTLLFIFTRITYKKWQAKINEIENS